MNNKSKKDKNNTQDSKVKEGIFPFI